MSKSIGRVFGSGSVKTYGYENNYINYLKNYDTSNYDRAQDNMTSQALNMSKGLNMLPEYQFGVDYSDEARKRAEEATYQSYVDKLVPQYRQQMSDLQTNLVNQGIPVGSEAYLRATGNLQNSQNEALNQAAYQSVLNGQNSYSQALADSLKVADFSNDARQSYIDQIKSLLADSVSGYENASNLYDVKRGVKNRQAAAQQSGWNNLGSIVSSVTSAITAGKK